MARNKTSAFLALALLGFGVGGCLVVEPTEGSVNFGYVFLTQDPSDPLFAENGQNGADPATFQARDCASVGASVIEVSLFGADGSSTSASAACDSFNVGDPLLTPDEFGIFFGDFDAGDYVSFSVKVLDAEGNPLPIRPLEEDATRLADPTLFGDLLFFEAQFTLSSDIILDLDFSGAGQFGVDLDGNGVAEVKELQIFVPFDGQ